MEKKKARTTPEPTGHDEDSPELVGEQRQRFATAVGVLLYMSGDRPDAQHCIRELASQLTRPTRTDYQKLEHLVLYLKGTSGYAIHMPRTWPGRSVLDPRDEDSQSTSEDLLEVFTDSDWAGNRRTRKSVSVAHFYLNGVLLHILTRSQKSIALSSCEAEYVGHDDWSIGRSFPQELC